MKCKNCGAENKKNAKFCIKCGSPLNVSNNSGNNSKYVIVLLIIVIITLAGILGFFVLNSSDNHDSDIPQNNNSNEVNLGNSQDSSSNDKTQEISSKTTESKSWQLIGSYSGSGSGSKVVTVPEGNIKVELSAYPIKNYATNYLAVSGSNGESGGVDWGSRSSVETRSDSFTYTSSSSETFTIDYYETVSWEVYFYRYQ
ncbi:MAG: zinc ribbon domain-containing protein [Methanobrevibacter sp.]|uniref:zinc ribbon domain-containing protein n=1 Tax=Methanobrevibacter sp. TaxID=66852 RepID=UPI003F0248FB